MELQIGDIKLGHEIGKKPDCQRFIWTACADCGVAMWKVLLVKENKPKSTLCRKCAGLLRRGQKRGPAHNRRNLVGQRFIRLVAIRDVGNHPKSRESMWECHCDCGGVVVVPAYSLTSGNTKSCGCYHKIRTRQLFSKPYDELQVSRIRCQYNRSARHKGHEFNLSREEVKQLIDAKCYYCGKKPSNKLTYHEVEITYQGIDRKDNTKGYTPNNVVPCCIICNKMKKAMNHDEFIYHILKIAERFEVLSPQADCFTSCGGSLKM